MKANRTTKEGILFVTSPPNLTSEPQREAFPAKCYRRGFDPPCHANTNSVHRMISCCAVQPWHRSSGIGHESVKKVLQRDDLGDGRERAFWHALRAVHGSKGLVEELPNMPCSVTVTANADDEEADMTAGRPKSGYRASQDAAARENASHEFQFTGAPCPMLPLLKEMVRFERPFITWDIWNARPPLQFPAQAAAATPARAALTPSCT